MVRGGHRSVARLARPLQVDEVTQARVTGDQALGMRYGTVKVTLAARPFCFLKLTGITVAW